MAYLLAHLQEIMAGFCVGVVVTATFLQLVRGNNNYRKQADATRRQNDLLMQELTAAESINAKKWAFEQECQL